MSTIVVNRKWCFFGGVRPINVLIDGKVVGKVESGKSAKFNVFSGDHTVQTAMDWCKSVPVSVSTSNGENTQVTVKAKFFFVAMLLCFVKPSKVFYLEF